MASMDMSATVSFLSLVNDVNTKWILASIIGVEMEPCVSLRLTFRGTPVSVPSDSQVCSSEADFLNLLSVFYLLQDCFAKTTLTNAMLFLVVTVERKLTVDICPNGYPLYILHT